MHAVEVVDISKTFGRVRALDDVSLTVEPGEIRAIVGANGSGKSTLVKILSGYYRADPGGSVRIMGEEIELPAHGAELRRLGVGVCHQNVPMAPGMSVLDNLLVGQYRHRGVQIKWKGEAARARAALASLGIDLDITKSVSRLTAQERAMIGIARALMNPLWEHTRFVILDEPTATLSRSDAAQALDVVERASKVFGAAVLLINHRLDEVLRVSDNVSVLRDGRLVDTSPSAKLTEADLAEKMVGERLDDYYPDRIAIADRPAAAVVDVTAEGRVPVAANFTVAAGEILGLSGLAGSGYDVLPYVMFGVARDAAGTIAIGDTTIDLANASIADSRRAGLVFVPEDRARQSSAPGLTIRENITVLSGHNFRRRGFWRSRTERAFAETVSMRYGVRPPDVELRLSSLSGGNQQKALVGSGIERGPRVLMLHEPTEGVDIAARRQLLDLLRKQAAEGTAIIIASVEVQELAELCDRVLVFRHGRVGSELYGESLTAKRILAESF